MYNLELKEVNKKYRKSDFELKNISFSLPKGSIMGFIGENGAGKSTVINCILDIIKIDSGEIKIFGKTIKEQPVAIKEDIGLVLDSDNFQGNFDIKIIEDIFGSAYKNWDKKLFREYIEKFKLPIKQKISSYSKGMNMKLAISVALSHKPKILILDEPTSGLDPITREEVLDILLDFISNGKNSVLLSSHITSDLEKIADYIVFIHNGEIILNENKDELRYSYAIVKCSKEDFEKIDKADIIRYRMLKNQVDILIYDKKKIKNKYPNFIVDNATLDEMMLLFVKGEIC